MQLALLDRLTGYLQGDGYQARAFRSAVLTFISIGSHNFLRLASNLVLTRLLFPEAFGLMALVGVVTTGVAMFSDLGIRSSIIQDKRGGDEAFLNTAWTFQIGRGFLLGIAVLLLAHPVATFYEEPLLAGLLMVSALSPMINGFVSTRLAVANRQMILGRLTALQIGVQTVNIVAMLLLAWWLQSVWALAIGPIAGEVVMVIASHVMMPGQRNRLHFDRDAAGRLISFGKFVFISTLATFFIRQGNSMILGKFVGLDELAFFRIGFFLAMVPTIVARKLATRVIFPLYARRPPGEKKAYFRKINRARLIMTGAFLASAGFLAIIGDWLIRVLYDARYESAGILLVLIALSSLPELITLSYNKLPIAAGKSGRHASLVIVLALVQMGLILTLVPTFGVLGAAIAPGLAMLLTYPFLVWIIRPFNGWDPRHDAIYAVVMVTISALALWLHWDGISALLGGL